MELMLLLMTLLSVTFDQTAPSMSPPAWTSDDIASAIGSEADAQRVIQLVLRDHFEHRSGREFVLASQVRQNWLPRMRNELVRLMAADVEPHLAACGRYWALFEVTHVANVVTLKIGERCGCSFRGHMATFEDGDWHLGPPRGATRGWGWAEGIGSGCVGRPPGCPCFGR